LFVPGAGQLVRGEVALGLFFLSSLALMASLGWAFVITLDRITATLRVLDFPGAPAVWALTAFFVVAAALHMAGILSANPHTEPRTPHPVAAGVASAIVPGWGQILNGSYKRACLFVGSLWLIAAIWILASPVVQSSLASLRLFIPPEILLFCSPAVRFTAPAVVWALSIYDAAATAAGRR
jgi:TM2 domain-containing membrane protein YozV